jgi:hypothetical protein
MYKYSDKFDRTDFLQKKMEVEFCPWFEDQNLSEKVRAEMGLCKIDPRASKMWRPVFVVY